MTATVKKILIFTGITAIAVILMLAFNSTKNGNFRSTFTKIPISFSNPLSFTYDVSRVSIDREGTRLLQLDDQAEVIYLDDLALPSSRSIIGFAQDADTPEGTKILYQITTDFTYWYYFDGKNWTPVIDCPDCANDANQIDSYIDSLPLKSRGFKIKAILKSSLAASPILRSVELIIREQQQLSANNEIKLRQVGAKGKDKDDDDDDDDDACECERGMAQLIVRYNGPQNNATIKVTSQKDAITFGTFTNVDPGTNLTINASAGGATKLGTNISLEIVESNTITAIHTSCSQDIIGLTFGNFTVIGHTDGQGNICSTDGTEPPPPPPPPPDDDDDDDDDDDEKVIICHRTDDKKTPYVILEVDPSAVDGEGANDHTNHIVDQNHPFGDIIPIADRDNDGDIDADDCNFGEPPPGENRPPIALDDTANTPANTPITIDILANDSDPDGNLDPQSVTIFNAPNHGTFTVNPATGAVTYTPNPNFIGNDSFQYQVCDLENLCDQANVSITVFSQEEDNEPPVANDDHASGNQNVDLNINVIANDTDTDANLDANTITIVGMPSNGSVRFSATLGTLIYKSNPTFRGTDTFIYQICDTKGLCDTATVTILVNGPPLAQNDTATTTKNTPVIIPILANDNDLDGNLDPSTITIFQPSSHGSLTINTVAGTVTYTPDINFFGQDTFEYEICDQLDLCDKATVTITVLAPPIANNDSATTNQDQAVVIKLLANDSDPDGNLLPNTVNVTLNPAHGELSINLANGFATYTPDPGFTGLDSFEYEVCDNDGLCDKATVTIAVGVLAPPLANDDEATTTRDTAITIDVLANDSDIDGTLDLATVTIISNPTNGSITNINPANGAISYNPNAGFVGLETFIYQVCDNDALCDTATVRVTVQGGGGGVSFLATFPPNAADDSVNTKMNTPVSINILTNDSDPDGNLNPASMIITANPEHGLVDQYEASSGELVYTPNPNFSGQDSFEYRICDTLFACDTATVSITVISQELEPPIARADFAATTINIPVVINILANDADPDGILNIATTQVIAGPNNGSFTIESQTGAINYTPNPDFTGVDGFDYRVCDDDGLCATAHVLINITGPTLAPPVAVNDSTATAQNQSVEINLLTNDTDADGVLDPATVVIVYNPFSGKITNLDRLTGVATYLPNQDFVGIDSFDYQVCDNDKLCDNATVTITVVAPPSPPPPPPPPPLVLPPITLAPPPPVIPTAVILGTNPAMCAGRVYQSDDLTFVGFIDAKPGAVVEVQYSLNGGASWNEVSQLRGLGTRNGIINISSLNLEGKDYALVIRAIAPDGSVTVSKPCNFTISPKLVFGANEFVFAAQKAPLSQNGIVQLIIGKPVKIYLEAKGNTKANIVNLETGKIYPLNYDTDNHLWVGDLIFNQAGFFTLEGQIANSTNSYKRIINTVYVAEESVLVDVDQAEPVTDLTIAVWEKDFATGEFKLWNGAAFGQTNPLVFTDSFAIVLAQGEYYLKIEGPNYKTITSLITRIETSSVVTADIQLEQRTLWRTIFGAFMKKGTASGFPLKVTAMPEQSLLPLGEKVPDITVETEDGRQLDLFRQLEETKPIILFVYSAWNTSAQEQMKIYAQVANQLSKDYQLVALSTIDPSTLTSTQIIRGNYELEFFKPGDQFFDDYKIISLPQFFVLNQRRELQGTIVGSQSQEALISQIRALL